MSLLSDDSVVAEDSEECLSSQAQPTRERSASAARQEKVNVKGRMDVFVIFINMRIRRERIRSYGVKTPLATISASTTVSIMNLLVILIVLMLLFGGGGFYLGGPVIGGSGFGLILLICLILFFTGGLSRR